MKYHSHNQRLFQLLFIKGLFPTLSSLQLELSQIYDSQTEKSAQEPTFVSRHSGNVTAILGKTALVNCRVEDIGNRTVSWIRHRDTHLLTVGRYTYTSDQRFRAIHKVKSEDYLLQILSVQAADAGLYECQISTTPVLNHYVYLEVVEPKTEILGGPNIHLEEGHTMNLTCMVWNSPEPSKYMFWYHNEEPISYNSQRGGVTQITEKGNYQDGRDTTSSYLLIQRARLMDSGIYGCQSSVGKMARVNVHVIRSKDPAKWAPSSSECSRKVINSVILTFVAIAVFV